MVLLQAQHNSSLLFWQLEDQKFPKILPIEECQILQENNFSSLLLSNISCLKHAPVFTHSAAIRASVLFIMAVLSFFANVATIISIHRNRKHRLSSVYRLILHLTIADLFVTFFCIAGEAAWNYTVEWIAGDIMCKLFKFIQMFSLYLSTFVLVLIGVDRFVAVRYPMKALTAKYCNRFVAGAWIFSALCSIPQVSWLSTYITSFIYKHDTIWYQ
jgi:gonadotropin-releasing hormone receptor